MTNIKIYINRCGDISFETENMKGPSCLDVIGQIEKILDAKVNNTKFKKDFFVNNNNEIVEMLEHMVEYEK